MNQGVFIRRLALHVLFTGRYIRTMKLLWDIGISRCPIIASNVKGAPNVSSVGDFDATAITSQARMHGAHVGSTHQKERLTQRVPERCIHLKTSVPSGATHCLQEVGGLHVSHTLQVTV